MTAAVYIPMAKLLDVWGRAEGFLLMLCLCTLGLILMAASKNLPTYCAAQVRQVWIFHCLQFSLLRYRKLTTANRSSTLSVSEAFLTAGM